MNGEQLQRTAREAAQALPGVSNGRPFVDKLDVYKVAGKVFLIVTDDPNERIITVKVEPEHGRLLERQHATITPGRYLHKMHWISVGAGPDIAAKLVHQLVERSYDLVLETVPQHDRPEDAPTQKR